MNKKHVVAGLGEIGGPILRLVSKTTTSVGYDTNQKLIDKRKINKYKNLQTTILHICIPFTKDFTTNVISLNNKFKPECIVIHSTVSPYTTKNLQNKMKIPIIYSATRGVHRRMIKDLKKYTKFYAVYEWAPKSKWANRAFTSVMKKAGIKTKKFSNPLTLEIAKIVCDTSFYGWLITFAQLSNMIAIKNKIDYDEMWSFAEEIHKFLGNRPKMYPGFIGGHCVIPNLDLISDKTLNLIKEINLDYAKILSKRRKQGKKY